MGRAGAGRRRALPTASVSSDLVSGIDSEYASPCFQLLQCAFDSGEHRDEIHFRTLRGVQRHRQQHAPSCVVDDPRVKEQGGHSQRYAGMLSEIGHLQRKLPPGVERAKDDGGHKRRSAEESQAKAREVGPRVCSRWICEKTSASQSSE